MPRAVSPDMKTSRAGASSDRARLVTRWNTSTALNTLSCCSLDIRIGPNGGGMNCTCAYSASSQGKGWSWAWARHTARGLVAAARQPRPAVRATI